MTAEIAVLNKFGISIAADSAVTVETYHDGEIKKKVYNSANKIFTVSKHAPVAVMFYNTVTLGGVPWETIVKSYRHSLGEQTFGTLNEYADHFFAYLTNNKDLFPDKTIRGILFLNFARALIDVRRRRKYKTKRSFVQAVEEDVRLLETQDGVEGFDDDYVKEICALYNSEIEQAVEAIIPKSYVRGNKKLIEKLFHLLLQKRRLFSEYSGIVICGFGEDEYLPGLQEYMVDIHLGDRVRKWKEKEFQIDRFSAAEIIPFADTEVIRTLIDGISPLFEEETSNSFLVMMLQLPEKILAGIDELSPDQKKKYLSAATKALPEQFAQYRQRLTEFRNKTYTDPIKSSISSLPIGELGAVAEALLNSSQILKKVNPDIETVGGPVDVATISKGDGFVWIKRKHYFDSEINHAFMSSYLK